MVVAEQVQARLHRGEDLVDLRLPRVGPRPRETTERLRRFVRQKTSTSRSRLQASTSRGRSARFVRELGRLRGALLRVRQIRGRVSYHVGANVPPEPGDAAACGQVDLERPLRCDEIRRQIARRDGVEVVVVAVNPVDRRAERLVAAVLVGDVADAQPERDVGMARDDRRAASNAPWMSPSAPKTWRRGLRGWCRPAPSRSALSQMKSLLL
jgi:hypothetical protein